MSTLKDLTGQRFGRLVVIRRAGQNYQRAATWECHCDCGRDTTVAGTKLRNGHTKSCGCLIRDASRERMTRHGKGYTRLYGIWAAMKQRCINPNHAKYKYYGGKGVGVCDEWKDDFQSFYVWAMANGYTDTLTIDRIDNDKGYSPSNCRWATVEFQHNHTSGNRYITYNGETHTLAEWGAIVKIKPYTISKRLSCGWTVEQALTKRPKGEL